MKLEQELRIFCNFSPPLLVHPFDELEELFRGFERRSIMTSRILMRAGWCVDESCGRTVPHCGAHRKEKKIQNTKIWKTKVERVKEEMGGKKGRKNSNEKESKNQTRRHCAQARSCLLTLYVCVQNCGRMWRRG